MRLKVGAIMVAVVWMAASAPAAPAVRLNDPQVADKLGITVQQLHSLRAGFNLSNEDVLALPFYRLQSLLFDVQHPGIDKHAEEQNFRALRMQDEHGHIPPDGLMHALHHRRHNSVESDLFPAPPDYNTNMPDFGNPGPLTAGIQTNLWTWLGPGNIGGRVRAILPHPTATNILWCGGVDGGVWQTTNSGASWFPLTDFMANLAIASLAMDPTNANVIYAGTGEATHNLDAIRGAGIFKTTDGGATWARLASTATSSFMYVARLAIDPNNGQTILAATSTGIYQSLNGGTNWAQRTTVETLDIVYHPTDSTRCLASGYNGHAYYSTNGGASWWPATGLPAPGAYVAGRIELAYARSNPTSVYASVDNNSGEVYLSADGGQSYTLRNTGNSYLGGQGWYDNVIWVDPTNPNVLIVGGIDLWRSVNGGTTLTKISQWQSAPNSAHADHHAIIESPAFNGTTVTTVYFGDDGGVYRANNVYTVSLTSGWQELNNNLGITQFYGGAGNPTTGVIVGGTQDNGSLRYTPGGGTEGWSTMFGGDGGFSAADPSNANYFYGEYVYLQIHRSSNGGVSSSYIYTGITDAGSGSVNFISPYILDPNNANTMLAGGLSLWRSTNVKAATPSWSAVKTSTGSPISAIAVAPGNSDIIWVGHNSGDVFYTTNGTATTPTWFQRDLGSPNLPNRYCERIAIAPTNSSRVYVAFGGFNTGNLWRTLDSGATWLSVSGNLPAAPINAIAIAPNAPNTLYVGTEVGVYGTTTDGSLWSTGNDGPANVSVDELFWMGNKLVAVTHGRGMYSITPAVGGASLAAASSAISGGNGNGSLDPNECNQLNLVIQNQGGATATNIQATLTTATPEVTIVQGTSLYPNLAASATGTNLTPFQISTSPAFTCGTAVSVTLTLTYNSTTNVLTYTLPSSGSGYSVTQSTGASIVPGITDVGNHGDDVVTSINLPFPVTFYGQTMTNAALSSNGNLQFQSSDNAYNNSGCLPYSGFNYAIAPLWDDLRTDTSGSGIFTSTTGSAPNRIFNIEWRATYFSSGSSANFEVRLYEGLSRIDIIYGNLNGNGSTVTVGVQSDTGSSFTSFGCDSAVLSQGLQLTFDQSCLDGGGSCSVPLLANFSASPTNGAPPLTVYFTNLSTGATSYSWDFGDGNTSTDAIPSNVYSNAGTYTVSLQAITAGNTNVFARTNYIVVANTPPSITTDPHDTTVAQGVDAVFTVTAAGSLPLYYQWRFAGVDISGATDSAYTRANAQCPDTGSFDVVVTNSAGSVTSAVATLTVIAPPGILTQPSDQQVLIGQSAVFSVLGTNDCGGGLSYQWQHEGTNLVQATDATLHLSNVQLTNAGSYAVVLSTLAESITSAPAILTVDIPAQLVVTPSSLDFGTILTGATAQASFVISNAGGVLLSGTASVDGGPFALPGGGTLAVPAFSSTNILLQFAPITTGSYSNTMAFASNGGGSTNSLLGVAVATFSPTLLDPHASETNFIFSFETIMGKVYFEEYKDALDDPTWLDGGSVPGDGTLKTVTNAIPGVPQRFFRIRVQ